MVEGRKHKNDYCVEGCCILRFVPVPANRPPLIEQTGWVQATASGEVCGEGNAGHIEITAKGLVPLGVYTLWLLTDRGPLPAAPVGAVYTSDGADPNRLTVNSQGILNYYIAPLDFNPFKGIPMAVGIAMIQGVAITLMAERTTYGLSPGTLGVTTFDQLVSQFCHPRDEQG